MKKLSLFTCAGLLFGLAACDSTSVQMLDDAPLGQTIVLTEGIPAPPATRRAPSSHATIQSVATVDGSQTGTLSLNVSTCADGTSDEIEIVFTVVGNQNGNASFKVNTAWTYGENGWKGTDPVTIQIPHRTGNPTTEHTIDISIANTHGESVGPVDPLVINSFDITNANPDHPNALSGTGIATVQVDFVACDVPNTAPWLRVPRDMTVEATGPAGTEVTFRVRAWDREDGNLTVQIVCEAVEFDGDPIVPAQVVQSGDTFPLGATKVTCSVTDLDPVEPLTTTRSFSITIVDTTAPEFRRDGVAMGVDEVFEVIATSLQGWALDLSELEITAYDLVDGEVTGDIICDPAAGDMLSIGVGEHAKTIDCWVEDSAGNRGDVSFLVDVTLDLSSTCGFSAPLRNDPPYSAHRRNSAIPHKLCAPRYANGDVADDLIHNDGIRLVVTLLDNQGEATGEPHYDPAPGSASWKYDADEERYQFNAKTSNQWSEGTWKTTVSYAGITLAETKFVLRR